MWSRVALFFTAMAPVRASESDDAMDGSVAVEDFLSTGRTGRRNAVPDISEEKSGSISTSGMDIAFDKLNVAESESKNPGPSSSQPATPNSQTKS